MTIMNKICCIKLSLAARVIAMIGLITSVLVLTQIFTDLAEPDKTSGTVSILLGLDIDQFVNDQTDPTLGKGLKIGYMFFALIFAVTSAILIWGSIVEIEHFAFPWMICEAICFILQIATITIIVTKYNKNNKTDNWTILFSVCNLCIFLYFWIVVFFAQKSWKKQRKEERENMSTCSNSSGNVTIQDNFYDQSSPLPQKNNV